VLSKVMEPVTTCFKPDTPMREVIEEFLRAENVSGFPVCDENEKLVGLISLSDIMWHEAMQDIIDSEKVRG
jgi:CBS domain-containing protein